MEPLLLYLQKKPNEVVFAFGASWMPPLKVFHGKALTFWRVYTSHLAWECHRIPQEELESNAGKRDAGNTLPSLMPMQRTASDSAAITAIRQADVMQHG